MIPPLLHQTWKTDEIPRSQRRFVESWRRVCPVLERRFYDDARLREVVVGHFPEYRELYDGFRRGIERADFGRYALMHAFGGVYADLDMECLRSLEPLLATDRALFGVEPVEHAEYWRVDRLPCNACLLSPPGHPVWRAIMQFIAETYDPNRNVVYNTGPMALHELFRRRPEASRDVELLPAGVLYPLVDARFGGRREGRFRHVSRECRVAEAYAAHHWVHTYLPPWKWIGVGAAMAAAAAGLTWWLCS